MNRAAPLSISHWLGACVITQLLQLWGDGIAQLMVTASGSGAPEAWPSIVGILALCRLGSSAVAGLIQGRVITARRRLIGQWLIATALGSTAGFLLSQALYAHTLVPAPDHPLLGAVLPARSSLPRWLFAGLSGLVLGGAQWFVLWRQLRPAAWWIPLSAAGLIAADLWVHGLQRLLGPLGLDVSTGAWNPLFWLIAGSGALLYGLVTGVFWRRWRPA